MKNPCTEIEVGCVERPKKVASTATRIKHTQTFKLDDLAVMTFFRTVTNYATDEPTTYCKVTKDNKVLYFHEGVWFQENTVLEGDTKGIPLDATINIGGKSF